jgi:predicted  nucleic acid-binding Zn-ribbon protein
MAVQERMAKIEGAFEQVTARLDRLEAEFRDLRAELTAEMRDLRNRTVDRWEVRIWFIILLLVISLYRFLG